VRAMHYFSFATTAITIPFMESFCVHELFCNRQFHQSAMLMEIQRFTSLGTAAKFDEHVFLPCWR
jgi:hypothetical protein